MAPKTSPPSSTSCYEVVIIGAGLSGINTAYHVQNGAPEPFSSSYAILESRDSIGGTWDFFKYPGLRSDSDMFTFGLAWNPWTSDKLLASGPELKSYLIQSAGLHGIDKHIKYRHRVLSAHWSFQTLRWMLEVEIDGARVETLEARFIILGTGYYDYDEPFAVKIPGIENFTGDIIHPQSWPTDFSSAGKEVLIVGSGATAITLLPNLVDKSEHVTMLQRSPTYVVPVPLTDPIVKYERAILPKRFAAKVTRLRRALRFFAFYWYCKSMPNAARSMIRKAQEKMLPPAFPIDPHFVPRYGPMDQRLCVCPDGDFFTALRSGKADIVTDTIKDITEDEVHLSSGPVLHPDVIITATGLKLRTGGGIKFFIDGEAADIADRFAWKGFMLQNMPNLAFVSGYYNAAWTLGAEVTAAGVVRLMRQLQRRHASAVVPRLSQSEANMKRESFFKISSTYVKDALKVTPGGGTGQWAHRWNYFADLWRTVWGDHETGLQYY